MAKIKFGDDHAVAEQVGTSILLAITVAISGIVGAGITAWGYSIRDMTDSQSQQNSEQTRNNVVTTKFIKNATKLILGYEINGDDGNSSNPPPLVKYSYDLKSGEWTILLCKDVGFPAVKLSMNATGVVMGGGKIIPPVDEKK